MIGKPIALLQIPNQRLFSPAAAAQYLGISRNTLMTMTQLGEIQAFNFRGRHAFKLEDLDRYIDSLNKWKEQGQPVHLKDTIAAGEKPVAETKGDIHAIG